MDDKDFNVIRDMVNEAVRGAVAACAKVPTNTGRAGGEIGSREFAEDRTQINSLNNKFIFASEITRHNTEWVDYHRHLGELSHRSLESLDRNSQLQEKVNQAFFSGVNDRARFVERWEYNAAYDLANPSTLGSADYVRNVGAGTTYPANRAVDAAVAQSTLNNTTIQTLVDAAAAAAVAKVQDANSVLLETAIGQAVDAAFAKFNPAGSSKA